LNALKFTSWWNEKKEKHYIHITYHVASEDFTVNINEDTHVYKLKVLMNRFGPVTIWDLHVGATVFVFGKSVTLMQCSSETRRWIVKNAKQLKKLRKELENKLGKYERVRPMNLPKKPLVETHLRQLMKDVASVRKRIATYRPSFGASTRM
jgi:hypothetical protein